MIVAICGACGEAGYVERSLGAMLETLSDHGAHHGRWTGNAVGLGRRAAPATEGERAEPEFALDAQAGLAVAATARLDDRPGLCDALGIPRPERAGLADVELILRAWARWGRQCPERLLGDYAFAVWDAERRTLHCVRDAIGVRPLYYAETKRGLVFASTVEAVLAAPEVSCALDEVAVVQHLSRQRGVSGNTRTFYEAVRKVPSGSMLVVEAEGGGEAAGAHPRLRTRVARHWHPEDTPAVPPASDDAYAEEFLDLHARAVRERLRGGPVGVHLSGGLDCSGIAVAAARELRRMAAPPPLAFSWQPPREDVLPCSACAPEYALIDAVCEGEGLQVLHCPPQPEDVLRVLELDGTLPGVHVHMNEEPVQRCAAERGVRVMLSGWGGDEVVSHNGRGRLPELLLGRQWRQLAAECRAQEVSAIRFLGRVALPLALPRFAFGVRRWRSGKRFRRDWLVAPALVRRARSAGRDRGGGGIRRSQLATLRDGGVVRRIEGWAASGARRGIEYRYPLLDRRIVEFALRLPPEQFRRGRWGRWLARYALQGLLPEQVCWNRIKTDPARYGVLMNAMVELVPTVRRRLGERGRGGRAQYLHMRRLTERLESSESELLRESGVVMNALQLLDF